MNLFCALIEIAIIDDYGSTVNRHEARTELAKAFAEEYDKRYVDNGGQFRGTTDAVLHDNMEAMRIMDEWMNGTGGAS